MLSRRAMERITGVIFLLVVVSLIVTIATGSDVGQNTDAEDFRQWLRELAENQGQHRVSVAFDLLSNVLTVAMAGAVYVVFRLHARPLALFAAFGFLAAGLTSMVIVMTGFALDSMAHEFVTASEADADIVATSARGFALVGAFGRDVGVTFIGIGILLLGILIVWSGAVYRVLGWVAIPAGVLLPLHYLRLVNEDLVYIARAGLIATLVFLLATGIWLLVRGTQETPAAQRTEA